MEEKSKLNRRVLIIIAAIILIIIIVVYFISLGKVDYLSEEGNDKDRRIKWIDERLSYLSQEFSTKLELKKYLDEKVKRYFLYARIIIVTIILMLNCCWYYFFGKVSVYSIDFCKPLDREGLSYTLSTILDFNQFLILVLFTILFLKFETLKEIKDVMRIIHLEVRRYVYRKYKGLDSEIQEINIEITLLNKEKDEIREDINKQNDIN